MAGIRFCLLAFAVAVLAVIVNSATTAENPREFGDDDAEAFKVWDAFKPYSRVKRDSFLGPVGRIIGSGFLFAAKVLHVTLFNLIDTPMRWVSNVIAEWANYFNNDTPGNPIQITTHTTNQGGGWNIFG